MVTGSVPLSSTMAGGSSDVRRGGDRGPVPLLSSKEVGFSKVGGRGDGLVARLVFGGAVTNPVEASDDLLLMVSIGFFVAVAPSPDVLLIFDLILSVLNAMSPFTSVGSVFAGTGAVAVAVAVLASLSTLVCALTFVIESFIVAFSVTRFDSALKEVELTVAVEDAATACNGSFSLFWVPITTFAARFFVSFFAAGVNLA